jgi:hypothetical protein
MVIPAPFLSVLGLDRVLDAPLGDCPQPRQKCSIAARLELPDVAKGDSEGFLQDVIDADHVLNTLGQVSRNE